MQEHSASTEASGSPSVTGSSRPASVPSVTALTSSTSEIGAPATSSAEYIVGEIMRHKRGVIAAVFMVLIIVVGGGYLLYRLSGQRRPNQPQSMKITRLTDSGNATAAAISPDGN